MARVLQLDTSDFTVEHRPDGRVDVWVDGPDGETVQLDLHPGVAQDLALALVKPEGTG